MKVIQSNTSIPAIIVDDTGEINQYLNLNLPETDTEKYLQEKLEQLKSKSNLIEINLGDEEKQYLYYDDSILLKRLSLYPYVQLGVMVLFVLINTLSETLRRIYSVAFSSTSLTYINSISGFEPILKSVRL